MGNRSYQPHGPGSIPGADPIFSHCDATGRKGDGAAGAVGFLWYRDNHVFVEGTAYPIDSRQLDLREEDISFEHYLALCQQFLGKPEEFIPNVQCAIHIKNYAYHFIISKQEKYIIFCRQLQVVEYLLNLKKDLTYRAKCNKILMHAAVVE